MQDSTFVFPSLYMVDYSTIEEINLSIEKRKEELDELSAKRDYLKRQENGAKLYKKLVCQGEIPNDGSHFVGVDCTGKALIMSPDEAEFRSDWYEMQTEAEKILKKVGLNFEEWFTPSKEILSFAYNFTDACAFMGSKWYWSSDQVRSKVAYQFRCDCGEERRCNKERKGGVRLFRYISLYDGDPLHLPG